MIDALGKRLLGENLVDRAILATLIGLASIMAGCGAASRTPAEKRLIERADAICAGSRHAIQETTRRYSEQALVKIRHPDYAQSQRQIRYVAALESISTPKMERLAALKPPGSMRDAFERFVEVERQVYYDDVAATGAAHSVHIGQYIAALARHHRHEQRALELAADAGLAECSRAE